MSGASSYVLGGTVTGVAGSGLVLSDGNDSLVVESDGTFRFPQRLAQGASYRVTVVSHPSSPAQECSVTGGVGVMGSHDTGDVNVTCENLPVPAIRSEAGPNGVDLDWDSVARATQYNVLASSDANCQIETYQACAAATLYPNVRPPLRVRGLRNGVPYYFKLESVYDNGAHGVAATAGARPNSLAFDGVVLAMAPRSDGGVYLGGGFSQVGVRSGSGVLLTRGDDASPDPEFALVEGSIMATAPDGQGGWYIGGRFTSVDGVARKGLARIGADGRLDRDWIANVQGAVFALAVSGDTLYLAGDFVGVGAEARRNLAAVNSAGTVLSWDPQANWEVLALAASATTVYVGGAFTNVGGVSRQRLAAFDSSGSLLPWAPNIVCDYVTFVGCAIHALLLDGERLYAGGDFVSAGGAQRKNLAAFTAGGAVSDWNPGASARVMALAASGNNVYVGGAFTSIGGQQRNRLAVVDRDTGAAGAWNPGVLTENALFDEAYIHEIAIDAGTIYVGGLFDTLANQPRHHAGAFDASGALLPWNPAPNAPVNVLAPTPRGIYLAGEFTAVRSASRSRLAAIDADGMLTSWNPDVEFESAPGRAAVLALSVQGDTVFVGGEFTAINAIPRSNLAAFGDDGILLDWNPGADGYVSELASGNGVLYVAGGFSMMGGLPRTRLAAFDAGRLLLPWSPHPDDSVYTLAVFADRVYLGGEFHSIDGLVRHHVAALDVYGTVLPWNPDANGSLACIGQRGDTIYLGGQFGLVGGLSRARVAAVDADGQVGLWNPVPQNISPIPGVVLDDSVHAIFTIGETIYLSGPFTSIAGEERLHLAAFDSNDELLPWKPQVDLEITALLPVGDDLLVAHATGLTGGLVTVDGETGALVR